MIAKTVSSQTPTNILRRTELMALVALVLSVVTACNNVDDVTGDLIEFGQVYDCDMVEQLGGVTTHYRSRQCFADEDAAIVFMRAWADHNCAADAGCSGRCSTPDLGLDPCVVGE
jgi:hypothetical protein